MTTPRWLSRVRPQWVGVSQEAAAVRYPDTSGVNFLPTLIIDANRAAAEQMAEQLKHSGFAVDIAQTCADALSAVSAKYYGSMIFVGNVEHSGHMQCVTELRERMPHTWILMISVTERPVSPELLVRHGVDKLVVAPFSLTALISHLMAFSRRSR